MELDEIKVGDQFKEYIFTVIGECVGCIELDICQNLDGEKIKHVTDSHGGVGFISDGAIGQLVNTQHLHKDQKCTLPDDKKRGPHICSGCWMNPEQPTEGSSEC